MEPSLPVMSTREEVIIIIDNHLTLEEFLQRVNELRYYKYYHKKGRNIIACNSVIRIHELNFACVFAFSALLVFFIQLDISLAKRAHKHDSGEGHDGSSTRNSVAV